MANQNRQTLKQYFQTGNSPTQAQFADLIDSALNQVDDSITCDPDGRIGIGNPAPTANLSVRGRLFTALSGTLSVAKDATAVVGAGTKFTDELAPGDAIRIGQQNFKIASVADATHADLTSAVTAAITNATAYRDASLLLIENGNGETQFVVDKSGNVGIGVAAPAAKLHVDGKLIATELAGNGDGLTNLSAANLVGSVPIGQIPDLPAKKIQGPLSPAQLPPLGGVLRGTVSKALTGTVSSVPGTSDLKTSNSLVGKGTLFLSELNIGDALKIGDEVFTVKAIKDDLNLQLDRTPPNVISNASAYRDDDLIKIESGNSVERLAVSKAGGITWPLKDGQTASIGSQTEADSETILVLAAPSGSLQSTQDKQPALKWGQDGQVTIRGLLKADSDLSLAGSLSVGNPVVKAPLSLQGSIATPLTGTVTVAKGSAIVQGTGTKFTDELETGCAIQFDDATYAVLSIEDATHLTINKSHPRDLTKAPALTNGPLVRIADGTDATRFSIDAAGNVSVGEASQQTKLTVSGGVFATSFAGSGAGITNLNAANLEGTLKPAQLPALTADEIPDLPATKITGPLKLDQLPALTAEQIPDLPASKITGTLKPDQIPSLPSNPIVEWAGKLQSVLSVDNGNVGIGPENPRTQLVVSKSVPGELGPVLTLLNSGGSPGAGAAIDFDGWGVNDNPPTARIQSLDDGNYSSHLSIQTKDPGGPEHLLVERLRVDSHGNVGIGTSSPHSKLEIAAQDGLKITGFQPFLTLEDTNAGNKSGYLQSTNGNLNLIPDSFHHANSAAMSIANETGNVGIGVAQPGAKLEIRGSGNETVLSAGAASGSTCDVSLAGHVQLRQYGTSKQAYLQARDDSDPSAIGLVLRVQQAGEAGKERHFEAVTIDEKGNIGLGAPPTDARLRVPGILRADQLEGSGAGITEIAAANITGRLSASQLPPGSASTASCLTAKGDASNPIKGTVSTTTNQATLIGAGTHFSSELNIGDAIKIGAEVFTITGITDDQHLQLDRNPFQAINAATASCDDDLMKLETGNDVLRLVVDKSGTLTWPLTGGKIASVGAWGEPDTAGYSVAVSAPIGYLSCSDDKQWCLVWEPGGLVAIRDLLKVYGNLDLRGSLLVGDPGMISPDLTKASLCVRGKASMPLTGTVTVSATSPIVEGAGTKFVDELKPGFVIQFDNATYTVVSIQDATHLTIDKPHYRGAPNLPAQTNGPLVSMADPAGANQFSIGADGDVVIGSATHASKLTVAGGVFAKELTGSGAGITGITAANISGVLTPAQIPALDPSKISGQLSVDQIPTLPSSKVAAGAVGPGGRPVVASGSIGMGGTQNIFNIPVPDDDFNAAYYSFEIYTTVLWSDSEPMSEGGGWERTDFHIMTRTVLAGAVYNYPNTMYPIQVEPLIPSTTQTNHSDPKFPTVSFAIVNVNRQAWLQIQTTAGNSNYPGNTQPIYYYVYSQM
jgi:sorbitol-specific phosphotransferase system component IIA